MRRIHTCFKDAVVKWSQYCCDVSQPVTVARRRTAYLVLLAPLYLNDFAFIVLKGSDIVYVIDHAVRIAVLAMMMLWPLSRKIALEVEPARPRTGLAIFAIVMIGVADLLSGRFIEVPLTSWAEWTVLFQFHSLQNPTLYWLDLTIGLILVALSEELICRKFAYSWLKSAGRPGWKIVLISSVLFALSHWSKGIGNISTAILFGLLAMIVYLKMKRIWPLILAHWIVNFIAFLYH